MNAMVRLREAGVAVGRRRSGRGVLRGVSLALHPGEILGVIGRAGSGKSTLLRVVAGAQRLSAGDATVGGHPSHAGAARSLVGFAADPFLAPPELSGVEWLHYVASSRAASGARRLALVRRAMEFGALETFAHQPIRRYTRGMAQRLALATAAMCGSMVVLLDEVLTGLDPAACRQARDAVASLALSGRVVVIATHDLSTVERLATRVVMLREGTIVADVAPSEFLRDRVVELAFPGGALTQGERLLRRFHGSQRTAEGVRVPLVRGLTVEQVMAHCRAERLAVVGTRVRYRELEDLFRERAFPDGGRDGVCRPVR